MTSLPFKIHPYQEGIMSEETSSRSETLKHRVVGAAYAVAVFGIAGLGGLGGWSMRAAYESNHSDTTTPTTALASSNATTSTTTAGK